MGLAKTMSGVGLLLVTGFALVSWNGYVQRVAMHEYDPYAAVASQRDGEMPTWEGIRLESLDGEGRGQTMVLPRIRLSEVLELGGLEKTDNGVLTVRAQDGLGWRDWMISMEGLRRGEVRDVLLQTGDKVSLEKRDMIQQGGYGVGGDGVVRPGVYLLADATSVEDVLLEAGCSLEKLRERWVVVRRPESRGGNVNVEVEALLEGERVAVKPGDFVEVLSAGKIPEGLPRR